MRDFMIVFTAVALSVPALPPAACRSQALHGITWLVQERGFPFATAAYTAGFMLVTSGLLGNLAGGWVADWCARRWRGGRE